MLLPPFGMVHTLSCSSAPLGQRGLSAHPPDAPSSPPPHHSLTDHPAGHVPEKHILYLFRLCWHHAPHENAGAVHIRDSVGPVHHLGQCPALVRCSATPVTGRMQAVGIRPVGTQAPSPSPAVTGRSCNTNTDAHPAATGKVGRHSIGLPGAVHSEKLPIIEYSRD